MCASPAALLFSVLSFLHIGSIGHICRFLGQKTVRGTTHEASSTEWTVSLASRDERFPGVESHAVGSALDTKPVCYSFIFLVM